MNDTKAAMLAFANNRAPDAPQLDPWTSASLGLAGSSPPAGPGRSTDPEAIAAGMRATEAARAILAAEKATSTDIPTPIGLGAFLDEPDEPVQQVIGGLLNVGGRALLSAPYKAGKSTLVGNLARSLVDGTKFLGAFQTRLDTGGVVLIDDELDERNLRRWLRDQEIERVDRVHVIPLRGRLSTFNILDADTLARWAAVIRDTGARFLILDCLRPVLDALVLKESTEAGRFLVAFDELLAQAGVSEAVIVHHMGHSSERSRGDSRLRDYPDAEWRILRQEPEKVGADPDPAAPRFFTAFGRDVDVPEGQLIFDPDTRRLEYSPGGRKEARSTAARDKALPVLLNLLRTAVEPLSAARIEKQMEFVGSHTRAAVRAALAAAIEDGTVTTEQGPRNSRLHQLSSPVRRTSPTSPAAGSSEFAAAPYRAANWRGENEPIQQTLARSTDQPTLEAS